MRFFRRLFFRAVFRRSRLERDLADEIAAHIEERADALARSGLDRAAAVRQARLEFGAIESYKESCREAAGLRWPDELRQDLRYAFRTMRRSPAVSAVAILSLALGIGANTAIFSIVNSLLLTNLPIRDPERIASLTMIRETVRGNVSYPLYERLRARLQGDLAEDVCASGGLGSVSVSFGASTPAAAVREFVTANYFDVLGVRLIEGQSFGAAEDRIGAARVAIIGESWWRAHLGADPSIIGKTVQVGDQAATVVGIAGAEFSGVEVGRATDLWVNVTSTDPARLRNSGWNTLHALARMRPGVRLAAVQSAAATILEGFERERSAEFPPAELSRRLRDQQFRVESGATGISGLRDRFAMPLRIVMIVVALVLLIACANITNLLLARAAARQREIATRLSLGASRARLFRQFLTESLVLAFAGALIGVTFANWAAGGLLAMVPAGSTPLALDVHLSGRVLAFTAGVAIFAGLLFGVVPAFRAGSGRISGGLTRDSRGRWQTGRILSAAQIALSTVLVFGAALFVRTLVNLRNIDPGIRAENLLTFSVPIPRSYSDQVRMRTERRIIEQVAAIPGVSAASEAWPGVFASGRFNGRFRMPGGPPEERLETNFLLIARGFFQTIGAPMVAGRDFDRRDEVENPGGDSFRFDASKVASIIVNESFVRKFFPGENALGRKIVPFSSNQDLAEIVGVVRDVRHQSLRDAPIPTMYLPMEEMNPPWGTTFVARANRASGPLGREIERLVAAIDPQLKVGELKPLTRAIDEHLSIERLLASIAGLFSALALLLAAVGLYGVMAYAVTRRTSEIGLRMALGAGRRQVLDMILGEGVRTAIVGLALGIPAAIALARFVSSVLFAVRPSDWNSSLVPAAVLLPVAMAAAWLPAWRAANVDPLTALRGD